MRGNKVARKKINGKYYECLEGLSEARANQIVYGLKKGDYDAEVFKIEDNNSISYTVCGYSNWIGVPISIDLSGVIYE